MKKINYLFAFILLTSVIFAGSCSSDGEPTDILPTINFIGGAGFTSADVTLKAGDPIKVGINAFSNTSSNSKLVKFKIVRTFNNIPFIALDSTLSTNTFSITLESYAYPAAGSERWTFTITDKYGVSAEISFNITTTAGAAIKSYNQKILGSYDNTTYGSSFASADGIVYKLADAKANASKIDWMYYYGVGTSLATLVSPSDAAASSVYSNSDGPASWTVRNNTRFAKVSLPVNVTWESIITDSEIIPLATGLTETKANLLIANQIVAFKAVTGKMGLIKVESINGTAGASFITYSVKVQE